MKEELEEKILNYFEPVELKILDGGYNLLGHYNSVTIKYIYECVLNKEYEIKDIADLLLEMHTAKKICSLYCGTVENVVFHNSVPGYWNYSMHNGYGMYGEKLQYGHLINHIEELKLESQLELKT